MRALTYHGSHDVRVDNVPDPMIQEPDDIILRVTATAICGSDLHLYRGKILQVKTWRRGWSRVHGHRRGNGQRGVCWNQALAWR